MKKLAYIILVIAVLVVISHFVKQGGLKQPETTNETTVVITENTTDTEAAPATTENTPAEDHDVVDTQENVEDIIIDEEAPEEDDAVDVEETNPDETLDEEETIVKE